MSDLQKMLDQIQELMRQGSRDAAKDMMSQLQQMLDQMRGALAQRGNNGQQRQQMSEAQRQAQRDAQQSMKDLQDLIRRQEKLLDDTYKQQQEQQADRTRPQIPGQPLAPPQPGGSRPQQRPGARQQPPAPPSTQPGPQGKQGDQGEQGQQQSLNEQQKDLRRRLNELMQKFGEMTGKVPQGMGEADGDMRESEQALSEGQPGDAIGPETKALEALREGAQQSAQALAQQMGQGQGQMQFGFNPGTGGQFGQFGPFTGGPGLQGLRQGNRDPFGRQLDENGATGQANGSVKIPQEAELARAREILDELRRRLGDMWRPEMEMDYLRRLLRRF
jgi:hypothetical protein